MHWRIWKILFLLVNGYKDTSVSYKNAETLGESLAKRDIATVRIYPQADHIDVIKQFSSLFDRQEMVREDVLAFIETLPDKTKQGYCR